MSEEIQKAMESSSRQMPEPQRSIMLELRCQAEGCGKQATRGPGDTLHSQWDPVPQLMFCHTHWWGLSEQVRDDLERRTVGDE